ncbi:MAG: serine/threonine protein kinase [Chloroflexi bacterium]|nr:serine/threonine protein kinase [Chloroflexota bacterium]
MPYAVGARIDNRYEVRSILASGGMADVYRATDCQTNADVVVKIPQVMLAGDLAAFNRYQRELEIARGLDHPGLQRLVSGPDAHYMAFEYIEGQSLRSYLGKRGRQLPLDEALDTTIQLARTLEYVHGQGIVHRDLKPENILIDTSGHVTLTDFGIALRLSSRRLTFSHLSNAVGTPDYMAPEQVRGERGDARTDVYALGCVLFELLAGEVPYPAHADRLAAMQRKVDTDPPLIRQIRPDVPLSVEAILYRALRRRPAERYQSMAELTTALCDPDQVPTPASYASDEPPPKPIGDLPPWRSTLTIMAVILVVLLVVGVLAQMAHHPAA